MPKTIAAYAAPSEKAPLGPFTLSRREPGPHDVKIDILYCGVCHTDIHIARNEWKKTLYPVVPGHEILGRVTQVGSEVKAFKVGDLAAVGCMVDSCRTCPTVPEGLEHIAKNIRDTYNGKARCPAGAVTYGGYSDAIVVDQALPASPGKIRSDLPLRCSAPASPPIRLSSLESRKGQKVGIVGLGGLGHMGVKLANAFGAHVVLFTTSPGKVAEENGSAPTMSSFPKIPVK